MSMLIDSHCHLDRLETDAEAALVAARARGIGHFVNIGVERESFPQVLAFAEAHDDVSCTVGTHPLYDGIHDESIEWMRAVATHPKVIALGETGLDYHYKPETAEAQRKSFRAHIRLARELKLPIIVHTRAAQDDTLQILREESAHECGGVLHCFTESYEMASAAIDLGFYVSFSGILSFRNATDLRACAAKLPADRLLVETDAPWLAPVPYRGKTNVPAYVVEVAECLAQVRGVSVDDIAATTTENFRRLFTRAQVRAR